VIGICTSRQETAEAAARKYAIARPYWDAEAMTADPDIDIVDCGTRPLTRHAMVISALNNRKHVYNGIPFAADVDRAREIHNAWQASGRVGVVDAFSQWIPAHRVAKDLIDSGYLGSVLGGTCIFNISLFNAPHPQFPYNWFWQAGLGVSALRNLGSHALHMLMFLFGGIDELVAHDGQVLKEWRFPDGSIIEPQTNDFASLILRFKSGMVMQLQVSWNATLGSGWTLDAFGTQGRFVASAPTFPTSKETVLEAGRLGTAPMERILIPEPFLNTPEVGMTADTPMPASHPMALSMNRMVEAISGRGSASPDFAQAWAVERALEAARRSALNRCWVRLDAID